MSDALSFTEINEQHAVLLPARTVLSLSAGACGGRGGNCGVGGPGGACYS